MGEKAIAAFSDTTKGGELCRARYAPCRDFLLRQYNWRFAAQRTSIAALVSDDPIPPAYLYQHEIPNNVGRFLKPSVANTDDEEISFDRIGRRLYTNYTPIWIRYVRSYTTTDDGIELPDDFAEVLSCYLAADICLSITQNKSLREDYLSQYQALLQDARFNGAIERSADHVETSEWLEARIGLTHDIDPTLRGLET